MPIRIEHQPSAFAVGVAGYAAGRGAARERQGKYALDLWQDQQRMQNQQNLLNQRNQWLDDRDAKNSWETMPNLSKIPDWVDPQTRKDLADRAAAIRDTRRKFGWDDPNARQVDRDLIGQYEDIIGRLTPPSEAEAWNRGLTYVDEKTGQAFDKPGEGLVPYRGGQRAIDDSAERAAAKQQQQQQQAEATRQYMEDMDSYNEAVKKAEAWDERFRKGVIEKSNPDDSTNKGKSDEQIRGEVIADMQRERWGYRPDVPARPARPSMVGASTAPAQQPAMPSSGATAGEQPIVVTPDMAAEPVPIPGQTPTGPRATTGAAAALRDPNTRAMPIPSAPVGAQGGAAVQDDGGFIDLTTSPLVERQELPEDTYQMLESSGGLTATQQRPKYIPPVGAERPIKVDLAGETYVADQRDFTPPSPGPNSVKAFTPEMLQQARRIAQTPAGRAALQESYGVDFAMPEEQQQSIGPLDTTQRQHVEAMRGPQGTGEGIPSDAARVAGQVQGAGSLAGRTAGYARRDAGQLLPGQTRTTKYNVTPTADEREAAMNERWARAEAKRIERENAKPDVLSMGVKPKTPFDEALNEAIDLGKKELRDQRLKKNAATTAQKREAQSTARGNAVAAQGIGKSIERAQRLGKAVPTVQRAIRAAVMGDVAAQKALDERGIRWRA